MAVLYGLILAAMGWDDPNEPDIMLLSLKMMAKEFMALVFDFHDGRIVGIAGLCWGS